MTDLKRMRFTTLQRQEQINEKIWRLEQSVIEQQVEETEVTKTRSELKELKERQRTLSLLVDHEQHWIETVATVSGCGNR